jgi:hypothetical protein
MTLLYQPHTLCKTLNQLSCLQMEKKIDLILEEMMSIKTEMKKIDILEQKVQNEFTYIKQKIDDLQQISTNVNKLTTEVNDTKVKLQNANIEITTLKSEVESLQRAKASRQIIVDNMPHRPKEDLPALITNILAAMNCPKDSAFPTDAYRLGKYNPARARPPPLLLEFSSTHIRDSVMTYRRHKKTLLAEEICPENFGLGPEERHKIYINKNYSPSIRALLKEARKLKPSGFKIVYEFANSVYVKRSINDEPIKIKDSDFIQELMEQK